MVREPCRGTQPCTNALTLRIPLPDPLDVCRYALLFSTAVRTSPHMRLLWALGAYASTFPSHHWHSTEGLRCPFSEAESSSFSPSPQLGLRLFVFPLAAQDQT
jgi:hypothetical protein